MRIESNTAALRTSPLFALLTDDERRCVEPAIQVRTCPPRSPILRSGEVADGVYLLLSGTVCVSLDDGQGHTLLLETLPSGELFGETCLLQGAPSITTFEAQTRCELLFVPRKALLDCLEHNAPAAMYLARLIGERLEAAQRRIASFAFDDVYTRVSRILLTQGNEEAGAWFVEPGAERIASMVGASREMISRVMKDLVGRGLVRRQKRKLIVPDRARLEDWQSHRRSGARGKKAPEQTGLPAPIQP